MNLLPIGLEIQKPPQPIKNYCAPLTAWKNMNHITETKHKLKLNFHPRVRLGAYKTKQIAYLQKA